MRNKVEEIKDAEFDELDILLHEHDITYDRMMDPNKMRRKLNSSHITNELLLLYLAYILGKQTIRPEDYIEFNCIILLDNFYAKYDTIYREHLKEFYNIGYNFVLTQRNKRTRNQEITEILLESISGTKYTDYLYGKLLDDVAQIKRQYMIDREKKQGIDTDRYKEILDKSLDQMISKNARSGYMEYMAEALYNMGFVEACKEEHIPKLMFVAELDSRTTKMCRSLDGQIFYVENYNRFIRYSEEAKGEIEYNILGLIPGINQPPIDDHFHWCRSWLEII